MATAVSDSGNILMGHKFGSNKPMEVINMKNVIYAIVAFFIVFDVVTIIALHWWIPYIFDVTKTALPLAQHVLLLVAVFTAFDASHVAQTGMAKAWLVPCYFFFFS